HRAARDGEVDVAQHRARGVVAEPNAFYFNDGSLLHSVILSRMREEFVTQDKLVTADKPAVRVQALSKRYGRLDALAADSLQVSGGEAFGLVGANGAGKTTLIKCVLDLCAFDSGTVEIFGVAARRPESRRRLAYVPERFVPPHY